MAFIKSLLSWTREIYCVCSVKETPILHFHKFFTLASRGRALLTSCLTIKESMENFYCQLEGWTLKNRQKYFSPQAWTWTNAIRHEINVWVSPEKEFVRVFLMCMVLSRVNLEQRNPVSSSSLIPESVTCWLALMCGRASVSSLRMRSARQHRHHSVLDFLQAKAPEQMAIFTLDCAQL